MTGDDKKIKLRPAEENRWWDLLEQTKGLDYHHAKPHGWHWFWGLDYLYNKMQDISLFPPEKMKNAAFFDVETIQGKLPDGHWLKKLDSTELKNVYDSEEHRVLVETLKEIFKQGETIIHLIDFSKLRFDNLADFSNLVFPFDVSFEHTEFSNCVFFHDAIFCRQGNFNKTQFSGNSSDSFSITFDNSIFLEKANFIEANFISDVSFNRASFPMIANFYKATFSEMVDFFRASFSRIAVFEEATFSDHISFRNVKFLSFTNFENAIFEVHAPKFYGAEINDEIFWTGIKLPKFEKASDDETEKKYKKRIKDNRDAYENLSTKLGNQKKYHDEHFFFRHETRCRQELEKNIISFWAFWFYENVSDYGYGVGRAIATWFVHIIIGALTLFYIRSVDQPDVSFDDFGCSVGISLSNSHAFFFKGDRLKDCYKTFESLPWFNVIWGVQTITGTLLIFLVLLTLRVRFRLK